MALASLALAAAGCGGTPRCDDAAFAAVRGTPGEREVTVCGTIARVRRTRVTRSGRHAYADLALPGQPTVEIVVDEDRTGPVPLRRGERAVVRGRYYDDAPGRDGIDWTHAGVSRRWPYPGYLELDGRRYR